MVGSLIAAMACLAMALHAPEERLQRLHAKVPINAYHLFLATFTVFLGWQAIYYARYFWDSPQLAQGVTFHWPHLVLPLAMVLAIGSLVLRWTFLIQLMTMGAMIVAGAIGAVVGFLITRGEPAVAEATSPAALIMSWPVPAAGALLTSCAGRA
jgi:hypothetical protein